MERRYIEHTIKAGDRFDLLAYKYWGDCNYAPLIVVDNQHISVLDYNGLNAGEVLLIREKIGEDDLAELKNNVLPFWKR